MSGFRTDYSDGSYVVSGALLNDEHRVLNAVQDIANDGTTRHDTTVIQRSPAYIGVFQVTNADDTCAYSSGEYQAPCRSKNLYIARMQVWNGTTQVWQEYTEDIPVDASCRYDTRQVLVKGEKFSGVFDRLRNWLIPISVPGAYHLVLTADLDASDGVTAESATATVKKRNATTSAFETAQDADSADMTVTVYSWYSGAVTSGTRIMAVRDGFGDLWLAAVDCP